MKIDLINVNKMVDVNSLNPVENPIIFAKGSIPTSDGLLSTDIFGISSSSRKETFSYIKLNGHFLHPFVYKMIKRMDTNIIKCIYGSKKFRIEDNYLVEDENGQSGLEFLYKNWDKIDFKKNESRMRGERIDVLNHYKKDVLFVDKWLVIPAFYRDANFQDLDSGKVAPHEITEKYSKLMRLNSILSDGNNFDFVFTGTQSKIQECLVEIYDLFKTRLEKKNGLIRKSLLGKSITWGARSVISAPTFHVNKAEDMPIDFDHCGIPLAQCCSLFTPFIVYWVKRFFEREFEQSGKKYPYKDKNGNISYVELDDPESYFNDDYIEKHINKFVFSYNDRFEKIELPVKNHTGKMYLNFTSRIYNKNDPASESPISRPITWCDLLYMAAFDVTSDKHVWITRYPIIDYFNTFPNKIFVMSTKNTVPMYINETVYKTYPVIDPDINKNHISRLFVDTLSMSNLYLKGLGGDYDGDQVSIKGVYTQEANDEAHEILNSVAHLIDISGRNMRVSTNESIQTMYALTKRD